MESATDPYSVEGQVTTNTNRSHGTSYRNYWRRASVLSLYDSTAGAGWLHAISSARQVLQADTAPIGPLTLIKKVTGNMRLWENRP